jgi:hypothetical protein
MMFQKALEQSQQKGFDMKSHYGLFITLLGLMMVLTTNVQAAQTFTGTASTQGDADLNCQDIALPSSRDAEADADRQASEYCDTFNQTAVRASDFLYQQSGCHIEGHGFVTHSVQSISATADYRCAKATVSSTHEKIFFETGFRQCEADCSKDMMDAEGDALAEAKVKCAPVLARQVSDWNVQMIAYGRLSVTAAFACADEGL